LVVVPFCIFCENDRELCFLVWVVSLLLMYEWHFEGCMKYNLTCDISYNTYQIVSLWNGWELNFISSSQIFSIIKGMCQFWINAHWKRRKPKPVGLSQETCLWSYYFFLFLDKRDDRSFIDRISFSQEGVFWINCIDKTFWLIYIHQKILF